METNVKNTFINVVEEKEGETPEERSKRRTKTEPSQGVSFHPCGGRGGLGESDADEADPDHSAQPKITFTKTFDPFDKSPGSSPQGPGEQPPPAAPAEAPAPPGPAGLRATVKNTFIDFEPGEQRNARRTKTAPSKRVAFGAAGDGDGEEDGEEESQEEVLAELSPQETPGSRQPSLGYTKTFDRFDSQQEMREARPLPPAGTVSAGLQPAVPLGSALALAAQQQPQVFTIPIPAGLPVGASHAVQLPMGLPPGSTILVVPTAMGHVAGPAGGPAALLAASPQAHAPSLGAAAALLPGGLGGGPAVQLQAQSIAKASGNGILRITYTVDARKLKANDKAIISPPFEISPANPGQYRVIINPSPTKARGGATFKNSGGMGNVQLKCENPTQGSISFRISTGDGQPGSGRQDLARGPVEHDFADGGVCGLPKKQEEWDFNRVVDPQSKTFAVFLDIAA